MKLLSNKSLIALASAFSLGIGVPIDVQAATKARLQKKLNQKKQNSNPNDNKLLPESFADLSSSGSNALLGQVSAASSQQSSSSSSSSSQQANSAPSSASAPSHSLTPEEYKEIRTFYEGLIQESQPLIRRANNLLDETYTADEFIAIAATINQLDQKDAEFLVKHDTKNMLPSSWPKDLINLRQDDYVGACNGLLTYLLGAAQIQAFLMLIQQNPSDENIQKYILAAEGIKFDFMQQILKITVNDDLKQRLQGLYTRMQRMMTEANSLIVAKRLSGFLSSSAISSSPASPQSSSSSSSLSQQASSPSLPLALSSSLVPKQGEEVKRLASNSSLAPEDHEAIETFITKHGKKCSNLLRKVSKCSDDGAKAAFCQNSFDSKNEKLKQELFDFSNKHSGWKNWPLELQQSLEDSVVYPCYFTDILLLTEKGKIILAEVRNDLSGIKEASADALWKLADKVNLFLESLENTKTYKKIKGFVEKSRTRLPNLLHAWNQLQKEVLREFRVVQGDILAKLP